MVSRAGNGNGRSGFLAREPGDRSHPLPADAAAFDPRDSAWYLEALRAKDRTFTPVHVDARRKELAVSLAQPVYDADGTGNCSWATCSLLMLRRMATWVSRIISHTHTVAKVAIEAISRNTFSGIR